MKKPFCTLFMLMSADGKICTGDNDCLDVDCDFPKVKGVREGLHQYYEIEQCQDLWSLNTGRVMAKIGMNEAALDLAKTPVSFVIIDNQPHLSTHGIKALCQKLKQLILVTTNPKHPAYDLSISNLHIISQPVLDLPKLMDCLAVNYQIERITVQSGGTMNGLFLREHLLDQIDLVIAPVLIGGKNVATLIDGEAIHDSKQLDQLDVLQLEACSVLEDSYLRLQYKVIHES